MQTEGIDEFDWVSREQREGFMALIQYYNQFGKHPGPPIDCLFVVFLIQKAHEATEYWSQTFGDQCGSLMRELQETNKELERAFEKIDALNELTKNQTMLLSRISGKS